MKDELARVYAGRIQAHVWTARDQRKYTQNWPFWGWREERGGIPMGLPLFLSSHTLPSITLTLLLVCTLRGDLKALLFPPLKNHSNRRGSSQACIFEEQPALPVVSFLLSP